MERFPEIGSKVIVRCRWGIYHGTVTEHYPHYDEALRRVPDPGLDSVCVEVEDVDGNFPYLSGRIAPSLNEIKLV